MSSNCEPEKNFLLKCFWEQIYYTSEENTKYRYFLPMDTVSEYDGTVKSLYKWRQLEKIPTDYVYMQLTGSLILVMPYSLGMTSLTAQASSVF